ncbi:unnamed protein product [marine sediment metagenome]|uniref:Uncharacterized protein n=1 Tax=marine sediment metagenome TaxID=412755 RepID=X0W992_9ZZZZ
MGRTTLQRILGDAADDTAPVKHYGPVTVRVELHPHQVQPAHIVINSLDFRTDARNLGTGQKRPDFLSPEQRERIMDMLGEGFKYDQLAEIFGVGAPRIRQIKKEMQDD